MMLECTFWTCFSNLSFLKALYSHRLQLNLFIFSCTALVWLLNALTLERSLSHCLHFTFASRWSLAWSRNRCLLKSSLSHLSHLKISTLAPWQIYWCLSKELFVLKASGQSVHKKLGSIWIRECSARRYFVFTFFGQLAHLNDGSEQEYLEGWKNYL